ncbi:Annexin [Hymenopellis radicata]|nr:Annexin [Hymenopellis radicata]
MSYNPPPGPPPNYQGGVPQPAFPIPPVGPSAGHFENPPMPTAPTAPQTAYSPTYTPSFPQAQAPAVPGTTTIPPIVQYLGAFTVAPGVEAIRTFDPTYDPDPDKKAIEKAAKGFGCDAAKVVEVLKNLTTMQLAILEHYTRRAGRSVVSLLDSELGGDIKYLVHGFVSGPLMCDAWVVYTALKGFGTDEEFLNEVVLGRSNEELHLLKLAYPQLSKGRSLQDAVASDLSGKTERLFAMVLTAARDTGPTFNTEHVTRDVEVLYHAGQGMKGTDEIAFCNIIVNSSPQHLTEVIRLYDSTHKSLTKIVKAEFSGHMQRALLHMIKGVKLKRLAYGEGVWRDVKYIEKAMKGGKMEGISIRILRASWSPIRMQQIKFAYEKRYGKPLEKRMREVSKPGPYLTMMLALLAKGDQHVPLPTPSG